MITVCIRYTIDIQKTAEFEQYARNWSQPIARCGGELLGYFLPTKLAGPTNIAYALSNFALAFGRQVDDQAMLLVRRSG